MGIRFECPNGHRLHVKAFLAGKRGICPECETKFIVPAASGGLAETVSETADELVSPAVPDPPPLPPLPESAQSLPDLWYVRPAGGGQFGPANTETMCGWVACGRVPADSWVWRTGWAEWKIGTKALAELGVPVDQSVVIDTPPIEPDVHVEITPAKSYHIQRKSRRLRAKMIAMTLSAMVFLLFVALVLVLSR